MKTVKERILKAAMWIAVCLTGVPVQSSQGLADQEFWLSFLRCEDPFVFEQGAFASEPRSRLQAHVASLERKPVLRLFDANQPVLSPIFQQPTTLAGLPLLASTDHLGMLPVGVGFVFEAPRSQVIKALGFEKNAFECATSDTPDGPVHACQRKFSLQEGQPVPRFLQQQRIDMTLMLMEGEGMLVRPDITFVACVPLPRDGNLFR